MGNCLLSLFVDQIASSLIISQKVKNYNERFTYLAISAAFKNSFMINSANASNCGATITHIHLQTCAWINL